MSQRTLPPPATRRRAAILGAGAVGTLAIPLVSELQIKRAERPLSDRWREVSVAPRGETLLGVSFRLPQIEILKLDADTTLRRLLDYPFQVLRLGAYWNRIESEAGQFDTMQLDRQIEAAERAGKQIILGVGAVKMFGYPEFFAPAHHLRTRLREGRLVTPSTHPTLCAAATEFIGRIVERYRDHESIIAWQVEHEAVDPLGVEHWWRLSRDFVRVEVEAVRAADPSRSVTMNGFLQTSLVARFQQWLRTRDQGDSLAAAQALADIVGVDYYPRIALVNLGGWTAYLDGSRRSWNQHGHERLLAWAASTGHRMMIAEGQAEPWEAVTTPPNPRNAEMYSCLPEHLIENYTQCMRWSGPGPSPLYAYLFWGAEYWMLRGQGGDPRYLQAFARVLEAS